MYLANSCWGCTMFQMPWWHWIYSDVGVGMHGPCLCATNKQWTSNKDVKKIRINEWICCTYKKKQAMKNKRIFMNADKLSADRKAYNVVSNEANLTQMGWRAALGLKQQASRAGTKCAGRREAVANSGGWKRDRPPRACRTCSSIWAVAGF